MAYKMKDVHSDLKSDLETVIGLSIGQFVLGILCVICAVISVEIECYQYSLGVAMWTGTLFMTTGAVGYALKTDISSKLVRDSFVLSIISSLGACMLIGYGSLAAWADFTDGKNLQGGIDVTVAVLGLAECCVAISSAIFASRLPTGISKYAPLRITEHYTTKDRTIILIPMRGDDIPMIKLPEDHKLVSVKVTG
ncbi:uncharacterized protein LOC100373413 [Saccoglossus kowalevskii]|uniref:Uncharacterized protein LOC100373413 n=1 Tax=Saccoglossus kowalevskii TaxID=10224 RepID=A0ABM0GPF3_SACKO|nr:PREDICTED: uncharacterized protein LOC100373413 [Saccoglossus kowalevskii]